MINSLIAGSKIALVVTGDIAFISLLSLDISRIERYNLSVLNILFLNTFILEINFPEAYPKNNDDKYVFNPSGMTVYLMKALQEAIEKIETLETKVAALEAK